MWRSRKKWRKKKRYNIREDCGIYSHLWMLRGRIGIVGAIKHVHAAWFFNSKNTHAPSISALITGSGVMQDSQKRENEKRMLAILWSIVYRLAHERFVRCYAPRCRLVHYRRNLFTCDSISGCMSEIRMRLCFHRAVMVHTDGEPVLSSIVALNLLFRNRFMWPIFAAHFIYNIQP